MKNLITTLILAMVIVSCDTKNQKELADLREENSTLKKMIEENGMRTLGSEMSTQKGPSSVGKLINKSSYDSSKTKYKVWSGEARNGNARIKDGIYPDYYFIGLEKMKYMVDNSYQYNKGKDSTQTIKGFALTMGVKNRTKPQYIFDLMIVPQIDSANFLLINPPASGKEQGPGSFGDGSILDDSQPCPDKCNGQD